MAYDYDTQVGVDFEIIDVTVMDIVNTLSQKETKENLLKNKRHCSRPYHISSQTVLSIHQRHDNRHEQE